MSLHLIIRNFINTEVVPVHGMNLLEAKSFHCHADLAGGEGITHTPSVEQLADGGCIHQLGRFTFLGYPESRLDKLLFVALHSERLVEALHLLLVCRVKPVTEAMLELM